MQSESILISKKVAATLLSISIRTLEKLIAAKQLRVRRVGRRVLINREVLEQFANRKHSTKVGSRAVGVRE
jgi:excisionase family DNA binding protein